MPAALFTKIEWLAPSLSVRTHVPPGVEPAPGASRNDLEGFPNHLGATSGLFDQFPIRLQNHFHGFLQIRSGLFKGGASGQSPQVFTLGWIADYPDQQNFHTVVWISKDGVSSRRTGFSNAKFDQLVRAADKETDKAKRDAAYLEAGKILSTDAPAAWLNYSASKLLRKPWIKGVVDSSIDSTMGQFRQWEIYVTKRT